MVCGALTGTIWNWQMTLTKRRFLQADGIGCLMAKTANPPNLRTIPCTLKKKYTFEGCHHNRYGGREIFTKRERGVLIFDKKKCSRVKNFCVR